MPNYKELCSKINKLPKGIEQNITSVEINGKKLFLVKEDYPDLIPSLQFNQKIFFNKKFENEIIEEMIKDVAFRNFICVNINKFLDDNKYSFEKYIEELEEPIYKSSKLMLIKKFGFSKTNKKENILPIFDDEEELMFYNELQEHYKKQLIHYSYSHDFDKNIFIPFKKLLDILKIKYETSLKDCILIKDDLTTPLIQDFFSCLQHHTFFEKYIIKMISPQKEITIIKANPIILINPHINKDVLDGYIELDGLLTKQENNLVLIECKNTAHITLEHITHFLGKIFFIEKIYQLSIKKLLFSTGTRYSIWNDIENYPELKELKIYDVKDFKDKYQKLKL